VHHVDGNRSNNTPSNLVICPNDSYHSLLHARQDMFNDGFNPDTHGFCSDCKEYHIKELFPKNRNTWNGIYNICKERSNRRRRGLYYNFRWRERMNQQYRRADKKGLVSSLTKEGRCL